MANYFICKVTYERQNNESVVKKVTEFYLVEAMSCTEAEARVVAEINPFVSCGELSVKSIKQEHIAQIISNNNVDDKYYRARVAYIELNESTGREKRTIVSMYVRSSSLLQATVLLDKELKSSLSDTSIVSVSETKIMDVYNYTL